MPKVKLPLWTGLQTATGADLETGGNPTFNNAIIDHNGNLGRRAGIRYYNDTLVDAELPNDEQIVGLHYWSHAESLIAVTTANVYVVTSGAPVQLTGTFSPPGGSYNKTSFAEGYITGNVEALFFVCPGGDTIQYITYVASTFSSITDCTGTYPSNCTNVLWLADRLLVGDQDSSDVYYSGVGDGSSFGGDLISAQAFQDDCTFISARGQELLIFGQDSIETYYNSGAPFERYQGGEISSSSFFSGSTIVEHKGIHYFLSRDLSLNIMAGREIQKVSMPLDDAFATNTGDVAFGNIVSFGRHTFYVLTFYGGLLGGANHRTYAYDIDRGYWSYWTVSGFPFAIFSTATPVVQTYGDIFNTNVTYIAFAGTNSARVEQVYEMKTGEFYDTPVAKTVALEIETPYIDHNTFNLKRSKMLTSQLVDDEEMTLSYKDEDETTYTNSFTANNEGASRVWRQNNLGSYRSRRYKIEAGDSGASDTDAVFLLAPIVEDVEEHGH